MNTAITVENVTAGYHGSDILKDASFSLERGGMMGVIGPNGAGKTTLMRTIAGMIKPSRGAVRIFGQRVGRISHRRRASLMGVVPQGVEVPMAFTAGEIVMMGRTPYLSGWGAPCAEDRRAVERAMAYADVVDLRDQPFDELSGGEKQRVIIALVLAQSPSIILMDEATSHLDINHRIEIMQIVERMNREHNVTVLMISHDLNLAAEFCSRLLLMDKGRVVSDGTPREVLRREALQRVYQCEVCVQRNPVNGSVTVTPAPRLVRQAGGKGMHVHVIAGGGAAEELLRRLALAEYKVTCGVVNQGDSDAEVARALDIETIEEKPFSPMSSEAIERAMSAARGADAVVLSGAAFGQGNVANLEIAKMAVDSGRCCLIKDRVHDRDYTEGRQAVRRTEELKARGAVFYGSMTELFEMLPSALEPGPSLKGKLPCRVGTSSYVIPSGILPNVEALASRVDDVELVLFESDDVSNLPSANMVEHLAMVARRKELSYTVHLPLDVKLGSADESVRSGSVRKCLGVRERLDHASPFAYVLHLAVRDYPGSQSLSGPDLERWREAVGSSVRDLLAGGFSPGDICVETLAYPFEYAEPIVEEYNLRVCLDIGHVILNGYDINQYIERLWPNTRIIHAHGIKNGQDHCSLEHMDSELLMNIINRMKKDHEIERVFTVEVFNTSDFASSMNVLNGLARGKGEDMAQ